MRTAAAALAAIALALAAAAAPAHALPTCSAYGMSGRIAAQKLTVQAMLTRSLIVSYATSCDYGRLEQLGRLHGTLRFGPGSSPGAYWRSEEALGHKPLGALVRVLRLPYAMSGGSYVWPSAAKGHPAGGDWTALVRAGVLTRAQAADERAHGDVYTGWRVVVTPDGDWLSYTAGR